MGRRMRTYQGKYRLKRPWKYIGNKVPTYRSSWEATFMAFLEDNKLVKRWSSEWIKVPYMLPDSSKHTYITDFYVEIFDNVGNLQRFVVEIKPNAQTGSKQVPSKPKNNNKKAWDRYNSQRKVILTNQFKWEAAQKFCKSHGFKFIVLTEDVLL